MNANIGSQAMELTGANTSSQGVHCQIEGVSWGVPRSLLPSRSFCLPGKVPSVLPRTFFFSGDAQIHDTTPPATPILSPVHLLLLSSDSNPPILESYLYIQSRWVTANLIRRPSTPSACSRYVPSKQPQSFFPSSSLQCPLPRHQKSCPATI